MSHSGKIPIIIVLLLLSVVAVTYVVLSPPRANVQDDGSNSSTFSREDRDGIPFDRESQVTSTEGQVQFAALDQVFDETLSDTPQATVFMASEQSENEFRDNRKNGEAAPLMVILPEGDFMFGSLPSETGHVKNEAPQTQTLVQSFAISKFEVTASQFKEFLDATNAEPDSPCDVYEQGAWVTKDKFSALQQATGAEEPAICVTWESATAYADWLSEETGYVYRLPTEAEWEYAAKAGSDTAFSFGDNPDSGCGHMNGADRSAEQSYKQLIGVSCNDGFSELAPVGSLLPNAFGLHDMHGNVWEWTSDPWTNSHAPGEMPNETRVIKGGSWFSYPMWLRSANRNAWQPNLGRADVGFRVVRSISPDQ